MSLPQFEKDQQLFPEFDATLKTAMYQETGDPRFYPPLLLRRKVKAGHLGRKTGRGWYRYDENGNRIKN